MCSPIWSCTMASPSAGTYGEVMPEQSNPITTSNPPKAFLRVVNPILSLLLRTPLAGAARSQFMVIDFAGRKSGRKYSLVLTAHTIDGILYALTGASWKYNFRDGATAKVLHNGKTKTMRGELIENQILVTDLYYRCVEFYGVKRAEQVMGVGFRDHRMPTRNEFAAAVHELRLMAIRFTPKA
jgi:hypothetical protein